MSAKATNDLDGQGGETDPAGSSRGLGPSSNIEDIAGRLLCAEEELAAAHRQCVDADEKFAHEIAQIQFAVGAIRMSWRKRHGI